MRFWARSTKSTSPSNRKRASKPRPSRLATNSTSEETSYYRWRSFCPSRNHHQVQRNPRDWAAHGVVHPGEAEEVPLEGAASHLDEEHPEAEGRLAAVLAVVDSAEAVPAEEDSLQDAAATFRGVHREAGADSSLALSLSSLFRKVVLAF